MCKITNMVYKIDVNDTTAAAITTAITRGMFLYL